MTEKRMCQHCGENFSPATADRHQTWPSHVVVSECRDNLERQTQSLKVALAACAIDEDNPDTCGVCGQHFKECDSDQRVGGEVTEAACAGARARETLRPMGDVTKER